MCAQCIPLGKTPLRSTVAPRTHVAENEPRGFATPGYLHNALGVVQNGIQRVKSTPTVLWRRTKEYFLLSAQHNREKRCFAVGRKITQQCTVLYCTTCGSPSTWNKKETADALGADYTNHRKRSKHCTVLQVAHHSMVTKLPNHWCASSCVITVHTRCRCCVEAWACRGVLRGTKHNAPPLYVIEVFSAMSHLVAAADNWDLYLQT